MNLSRREFVAGAVLVAGPPRLQSAPTLTAGAVIDRIKSRLGEPWREKTNDVLVAGASSSAVTGVAVMVMSTLDGLRRAAASRHNLVIVQEPTFYAPGEAPGQRTSDPVYLAKKAFIDEHGLVVFRFFEHWQARRPNPVVAALAQALGWPDAAGSGDDPVRTIPSTTLGALRTHVRERLGAEAARVVGQPDLPVRSVLLAPGTTDMRTVIAHLPHADAVIAGEPREWEAVPYAFDSWSASSSGTGKGMISVGRVVSLRPAARAAAEWIRSFVNEVPVTAVDSPDPFWTVGA